MCPCCHFINKRQLKLLKRFSKGFERSVYWNEYKTKSENKNTTSDCRYVFECNFVAVNRLFVLVYLNWDNDVKRYTVQRYYIPKSIIKSYEVIISRKNFDGQPIDPDIKLYKEIRKLTSVQGENYTTVCLLNDKYIKNRYRLTAVHLDRQKKKKLIQEQISK